IGMFVNTLPMRNTPKGDKTFEEFLEEVKIRVLDAFENQEYQFENLVEHRSLPRDIGRNPIFDVMLNLITQSDDTGEISAPPEEAAEPLSFKHKKSAAKFDLTLDVVDKGERLSFNLNYGTKLFKANTIDRFILYLTKIISGIVEKDTRIADLEIISAEEKEDLLTTFNNTYEEYPEAKTIHRLFEEQVAKTPDRVALTAVSPMAAHKQESPCSMTYRELEQKSTQTAQWLLRKGVKPGAVVGLLAERSCETMVGMLAILKTGGAYLPIEPDYPRERIQFMLQDSNAKLLLCKEHHYVSPNPFGADCRIMLLNSSDTVEGNSPGLPGKNRPAEKQEADVLQSVNPAYVIYTSGSTGKPKGVLVQHRSVVNLAYSQMTRFKIDTDDRVMQFASICFDASVEQIFITFFSGAALVLINKETILDENIFRVFTARQSVTHIHTVPSFLMDMKLNDFSSLRRVISGGDDCPPALAEKWMSRCDFYNEYGPTETTVTSLEVLVKEVDGKLPPPSIGKPIGNTSVYILDRHKRLVPRGVTGELYIGGDGVACGYLNRPELTAERFVNWSATTDDTPAALRESNADRRIYRTGDLARWLPDGNIRFLGRIDFQVKIRGFRIELGEIENQLLKLREIKETIVITKTNTSGEKYICAYVVPTHPHHYENTALLNEELRNKLSPTLPDYMLPSFFVTLEKIPLTPNGKVDRKALPEPGFDEAARGGTYVAPADAVEGKVTEIWSQILGIEESTISVNGNFFQMGGHSLKATVMISRIHKELESKVPLAEIFNTPSIRGIAQYIKNSKKKKYPPIKPSDLQQE
ncbi:MAG: amino acid adenylation domain-containing protein, partial [bacterium]|nr:amino acid adenylation domain-containing protein [bacterium]